MHGPRSGATRWRRGGAGIFRYPGGAASPDQPRCEYFRARLREMAKRSGSGEVRGYGLMIGVQLSIPGKDIVNQAMEEGLLMNCTHDTCCASCRLTSLAKSTWTKRWRFSTACSAGFDVERALPPAHSKMVMEMQQTWGRMESGWNPAADWQSAQCCDRRERGYTGWEIFPN